jgi:biotin carboxylase
MTTIKMTNLKNGTKTITGLTDADMRLLANALEAGAYAMPKSASNNNAAIADAVMRFASALRTTATFPGRIGNVEIIGGTSDASALYEEPINL